jgi:predicted TIM-barrel fold metal-dependent hydrolase
MKTGPMAKSTPAAQVRKRLSHPVVDADGHWLELFPVYFEFVEGVAGPGAVDAFRRLLKEGTFLRWYQLSAEQRREQRVMRPPAWAFPFTAGIRTPSMVPGLYYDSLDEWGIDVALIYPSMGLMLPGVRDQDLRRALVRGYNSMVAELFAPYRDRIIPAAICCMHTPGEAMDEAGHAVNALGLKLLMINGAVPRTAAGGDPGAGGSPYIDNLAMDSPYDYDPVWRKFIELKVTPTNHAGSIGWMDRNSPSSFVANHLGHFANGNHSFAKALFMGGVTRRHPGLNMAFLEGGVGWACSLYADLCGHWSKRNRRFLEDWCKPTLLDLAQVRTQLEKYAGRDVRLQGKIERILDGNLDCMEPDVPLQELVDREPDVDEFPGLGINGPEDVRKLFCANFYFGCEADDPATAWAYSPPFREAGLKPVFGSDISHFDVEDPREVLAEAWEQVEKDWLNEEDFRAFTFSNAVRLHGGMNADFFRGTVVEKAAAAELKAAKELKA